MKKIFTLLALTMALATNTWAQGTYALAKDDTPKNGDVVESVQNITMTYSDNNSGTEWKAAVADSHIDEFSAYTAGNGTNGNKDGGTSVTFKPLKDGNITVGVVVNANKPFNVDEDGENIYTETPTEKFYEKRSFDVKAGKTYKVYVSGSKMGFYGFIYEIANKAEAPKINGDNPHYGGTYITMTAEEGATIWYAFDKNATFQEYSIPFDITDDITIYAYATLEGKEKSDTTAVHFVKVAQPPTIEYEGTTLVNGETYENLLSINNNITITAPDGYTTYTYWSSSGSKFTDVKSLIENAKSFTSTTIYVSTGTCGTRYLYVAGTNSEGLNTELIKLEFTNVGVKVEITDSKFATFYSSKANVDFNNTEVTAYVATGVDENGAVILTKVNNAPKSTGLLLHADAAGEYNLPYTDSYDEVSTNLFVGVSDDKEVAASTEGTYHYVLSNHSGIIGFYNLASAVTVPGGKAYLETTTELDTDEISAKINFIFPEDEDGNNGETTGINEINDNKAGSGIYTLSGVKVEKAEKGLYIVNGKKVVVK